MKKNALLITLAALLFSLAQNCNYGGKEENSTAQEEEQNEENYGYNPTDPDEARQENDKNTFNEWDENQDGSLSQDEFNRGSNNSQGMTALNRGDDDRLDEHEWRTGLYERGDQDGNEKWDETEWNEFTANWDVDWGAWRDWDLDGDGVVMEEEWNESVNDMDWFTDWDADEDQEISEEDYNSYTYENYDRNNDGRMNEEEFNTYAQDWEDS